MLTPQEWIDRRFPQAKKKPHPSSVRRWIESGELPGKKIGGRWYVDEVAEQRRTGDDVVDRILNDDTQAA